jgi:flagellar motor switch protein FliN/FliY
MADNLDNLAEKLEAEAPATEPAEAAIVLDEASERNLKLILDIPLRVTVELGRTKMAVSDLLNLGQGSVVELSKLAGEPMEVLVNDKLIARGEAVVVNEKFGVRLTDIISTKERVEQLK